MESTEKIKELYPQTADEYMRLSDEIFELFCSKQLDYGPNNISLGRDMSKEADKRVALLGLSIRMNDKIQRLITLIGNNSTPNNESLEDTFRD